MGKILKTPSKIRRRVQHCDNVLVTRVSDYLASAIHELLLSTHAGPVEYRLDVAAQRLSLDMLDREQQTRQGQFLVSAGECSDSVTGF